MKFNIGDFIKVIESDQVRYGRITNAVFNDWYWYEIDSNPGTYISEAYIMPASEYEMMNSIPWEYVDRYPVVEEDISSVNDSEMDQILAG